MNRSSRWMVFVIAILCSTGCRENAGSLHEQAREAFAAGRQEEGIRCLNGALALDPDNLQAHFNLGWIYKFQGRADEAIAEFRNVIELHPNYGGAHNHLGEIYLAKDMPEEAIEAFKKAAALDPDFAPAQYGLGIAYMRQGALPEAAAALFKAGLLALVTNKKDMALQAAHSLRETENRQLAGELRELLSLWFDPADDGIQQPGGSRQLP